MANWTCEQCGGAFKRDKSGARPIRFCTVKCYHAWRKENEITTGQFESGFAPWNKGVKGTHFSPATEFQKGRLSETRMPIGAETVRIDQNGTPRAFVKVADPNVWRERALVVWERHHGQRVPAGLVVHHRDKDSLNDVPENLQALTRAQHIEVHRQDLLAAKRAA